MHLTSTSLIQLKGLSINELLLCCYCYRHNLIYWYLTQIETLKEEHENEIKTLTADKLSNTVKCVSDTHKANTGVPSKAPVRSDLICYSEAELLKKIKRSLDITEECDKLAYRYNTLLSVCKGE